MNKIKNQRIYQSEKYEIILSKTKRNLGFAGANNYANNNFINLNEDSNIFVNQIFV